MANTQLELTPRIVAFVGTEEGVVLEAYRDSKRIWTWAMGVAETGGHPVQPFKDKPQSLEAALTASVALMRSSYLPAVERAFAGCRLSEHQIAAALSFQWRHGHLKAQWVKAFLAGDNARARTLFMQWTDHGRQIPRATRERDLFFDADWPSDLRVPVIPVRKPSYQPDFSRAVRTDVLPLLAKVLAR